MCKAVHPFVSQHLVRVLTENAVEALADDDKTLLVQHLCPHNQLQALLGSGYVIGGKAWKKMCVKSAFKSSRVEKFLRPLVTSVRVRRLPCLSKQSKLRVLVQAS